MLRNELYELQEVRSTEQGGTAHVRLLPQSAIYAAHFKGFPVTPGACLVEMACELAAEVFGVAADVSTAADIRFLKPVIPDEVTELDFELAGSAPGACLVRVVSGETLCAQMKLTLGGQE